ncbi:hypothetical protein KEM56_007867 [Ascosphaera pollenicola]|nr:hypothetical protein KEM56_007867 [Ascosphaera pollenicola]
MAAALLPATQPMPSPSRIPSHTQEFGFEFPPVVQDSDATTRRNSRPDSIGDSSCRTRRPRSLMFFLSPSRSKARLRQGNGVDKRANSALNLSMNANDTAFDTADVTGNEQGNGNGSGSRSRLAGLDISERRRSAVTPAELQREFRKKGDNTDAGSMLQQPHTSLHGPALVPDSELKPTKTPKSKLKNRASVISGLRKLFRSSKSEDKVKSKKPQYTSAETPAAANYTSVNSREPAQDLERMNEYFTDDLGQYRSALESPPYTQEARRESSSAARQVRVSSLGMNDTARPSSARLSKRGYALPPALHEPPAIGNEDDSNRLAPPNPQSKRSSQFLSSPFRSLLRLSQHAPGSTTSLITDRRKEKDTYIKINLTPTNLALLAKEWEAIDQSEKENKGENSPEDEARRKKQELWQAIAAAEGDDSAAQKALAARAARRDRVQRHVGKWLEGIIDDEEAVNKPQRSPSSSIVQPFSS